MENETISAQETAAPAAPELSPVKRRRGRPPKFPRADGAQPVPGDSAPPKRRGRPPKVNKTVSYDDAARATLAKQLMGIHLLVASATGVPEIAIQENEAAILSQGIIAVAQEYGLALTGKTGAALQLFAAVAMVYVPRFMLVQNRIKQAKQPKTNQPSHESATVN